VSIPDLPYYLMPRQDFLFGLETENAEALSVIEGLRLPDYVILLPSPAVQGLDDRGFGACGTTTGRAVSRPRWPAPGRWRATTIRTSTASAPGAGGLDRRARLRRGP
jgi:hypothetical protein